MDDSIAKVIAEMRALGPDDPWHYCQLLREWADRLAALDGWRPIAEAPKDGTYLLLSGHDLPVWQGSWVGRVGRYPINGWTRFNSVDIDWNPTLFKPLPTQPKDTEK